MPDLETVGEQSAEVTVEAPEPYYPSSESPVPDSPAPTPESPAPALMIDSEQVPEPEPDPVRYPDQLIEIVVVKTSGNNLRKTSEVRAINNQFRLVFKNIKYVSKSIQSHEDLSEIDQRDRCCERKKKGLKTLATDRLLVERVPSVHS